MDAILLVIHVILTLLLITLVLIQHGKGAEVGASFGSGASSTVFGARGAASFLTKMTTFVAIAFFASSLGLAYISTLKSQEDASLINSVQEQTVPPVIDSQTPVVESPDIDSDEIQQDEDLDTGIMPADVPDIEE